MCTSHAGKLIKTMANVVENCFTSVRIHFFSARVPSIVALFSRPIVYTVYIYAWTGWENGGWGIRMH